MRLVLTAVVMGSAAIAMSVAHAAKDGFLPCSTSGSTKAAGAAWTALKPVFPDGAAAVTLVASPTFLPDTIYASNGTAVVRTSDGGCSWKTVLDTATRIAGVVPPPVPSSITAIAAPSSATNSRYLYVAATQVIGGVRRPIVYSSNHNGDGTWTSSDPDPSAPSSSGLPPTGTITQLAACNLTPNVVYAVVDALEGNAGALRNLYESTDSGVTWQLRTALGSGFSYSGLSVHPVLGNTLFALADGTLQVSNDAGAVWRRAGPAPNDVVSDDIAVGEGYVRMVQAHSRASWVDRSDDGGLSWHRELTPLAGVKQVAMAPLRDLIAVSDGKRLQLERVDTSGVLLVDATPLGLPPTQLHFSAPTPSGFSLIGLGSGVVMRAGFDLSLKALRPGIIRLLPQQGSFQYFPPTMLPQDEQVTLPAGASKDVPYTLLLPRRPSPVDVMFLVDTTGSMSSTIAGLRQDLAQIVNELGTLGLDVRFGLGDYKDLDAKYGGGGAAGDYPYALRRVIGPADAALAAQLAKLSASGGADTPESSLTALYQSTTGVGQQINGADVVDPGQQAEYRPGSLRVAVVATDAPFHTGKGYPEWPTVVKALRAQNVLQVGLEVGTGAAEDLSNMATDTGAIAPEGGIDCNGDGQTDIQAGGPLVCPVSAGTLGAAGAPVQLGPAVVALTEAAVDYHRAQLTVAGGAQHVALAVAGGGGHVRLASTTATPLVNLKADNEIPFNVAFTCPSLPTSQAYPVHLSAAVAGSTAASADATLTCLAAGAPPTTTPGVATLVAVPAVGAAAAPPANPIPNPNPNPNPNPVLNASMGIADQQQEEPRLALAVADGRAAPDISELAMSRPTKRDEYAAMWELAAGSLLLSAGAVAAHRSRTRTMPAWADRQSRGGRGR